MTERFSGGGGQPVTKRFDVIQLGSGQQGVAVFNYQADTIHVQFEVADGKAPPPLLVSQKAFDNNFSFLGVPAEEANSTPQRRGETEGHGAGEPAISPVSRTSNAQSIRQIDQFVAIMGLTWEKGGGLDAADNAANTKASFNSVQAIAGAFGGNCVIDNGLIRGWYE